MSESVLLSLSQRNFEDGLRLIRNQEQSVGVELMHFHHPDILDGDWRAEIQSVKDALYGLDIPLSIHGPFLDTHSGSMDKQVNEMSFERYRHALEIATELGARNVVFHANFIGQLRAKFYRVGWHERNVEFWSKLSEVAQDYGVMIALENMWEYDPTILSDLLRDVDHPYFRACIDVGHVHLFSDEEYTLAHWLEVLSPYLIEFHMNNNDGKLDNHHALGWEEGVLNYYRILPQLRASNPDAYMVLEMDRITDMQASLPFFTYECQYQKKFENQQN